MSEKKTKENLNWHSGHSLVEVVFALALFTIILTLSAKPFKTRAFQLEVADLTFMNRLKGAILDQRIRAVREYTINYNFILDGSGSVRFRKSGKEYLKLDDPVYRVYLKKGQWGSVRTSKDFKNQNNEGQNGFTILVYRQDDLMGKLVFQVGTSTFREEYNGPK